MRRLLIKAVAVIVSLVVLAGLGVYGYARQSLPMVDGTVTVDGASAPIEIGRGERLWTSPDELLDRFNLETVPSASGITHLIFWRR